MSNKVRKRHPILFCFCAPTASGKTTITKELLASDPGLHLSISTTTRAPRPGETDGKDYFFVAPEEFERKVIAGEFLEHATFSGNRYGTGSENLSAAQTGGADLLLDIDVQGAEQVRSMYPLQVVVVFVFPPSFSVLRERLLARATEDEAKMRMRLETAATEVAKLSSPGFSDYLLVNDSLPHAVRQAKEIIAAERLRCRHLDFTALVATGGGRE